MLPFVIAAAMALFAISARAQVQPVETAINPAAAETCVAVFTVMAYAYADDDLKERLLEDKKALARADIGTPADMTPIEAPAADVQAQEATSSDRRSSDDRIRHIMDVLTEMMLEKPAQAQGIARECFRKYPPEIELN